MLGMMLGDVRGRDRCQAGQGADGGELFPELPGGGHPAGVGHESGTHAGHGVGLFAGMRDGEGAVTLDERPLPG